MVVHLISNNMETNKYQDFYSGRLPPSLFHVHNPRGNNHRTMASPTISELAKIISVNTAKVNDYLSSQGLQSPAFHVDAPSRSLIPGDAHEIETAREAVIDATMSLHDLMLGPKEHLMKYTVKQYSGCRQ